jgi:hypothetical protein
MGMSKKDLNKHKGKHDEKMAKLEAAAASGSERAKKKLTKESRK